MNAPFAGMVYFVVDNEFNRANYSDLIGLQFKTSPPYAVVKLQPEDTTQTLWESTREWKLGKGNVPVMRYARINVYNGRTPELVHTCEVPWLNGQGNLHLQLAQVMREKCSSWVPPQPVDTTKVEHVGTMTDPDGNVVAEVCSQLRDWK